MNKLKYPNPIFIRNETIMFNDNWKFSFDNKKYQKINVPFCPESKLSKIGYTDFIKQCFYKKKFKVENDYSNKRVILHFKAVDYRCELFINNKYVGNHEGGYTPFEFDITDYLISDTNELLLIVYDNETKDYFYGKQSYKKESFGCFYTRTTGIWQDVWLEIAPENRIENVYFYPHIDTCSVNTLLKVKKSGSYKIEVFYKDQLVGFNQGDINYQVNVEIKLDKKVLWDLKKGNLYDVVITYQDDIVYSYFGLREVRYDGYDFILNNKKTYQKLVLDQGYYPDGIYTAKNDKEMLKDIDLAFALGFNGARLHQKVFDPKFLYLCDIKGYMVWAEFPSWGGDYSSLNMYGKFINQWQEVLNRDFNHPAIITWCPLNEVWGSFDDYSKYRDARLIDLVYEFTKQFDSTRPCVDVSGGHHGHKTDLYDFHCYESIEKLQEIIDKFEKEDILDVNMLYCDGDDLRYIKNLATNVSEYGGICISKDNNDGWGYGTGANGNDELVDRYIKLTSIIVKCKKISGFCYTQLYDVEQEQNGLYNYDRSFKLTKAQMNKIKKFNEEI